MTGPVDALVDALTERLVSRVRARDRLDALDEAATGPTYRDRVVGDPAVLRSEVEDTLDDLVAALADRDRRARVGLLCAGGGDDPEHLLARAGLAVSSWTDGTARPTDAGRAVADLLEQVVTRVVDGAMTRLTDPHGR